MSNITINNFIFLKDYSKIKKTEIKQIINVFFNYNQLNINYIDINFLKNEAMLEINKKYLNHNYDTDIITFNLSLEKNIFIADIYINVDMIVYNSNLFKTSFDGEFKRLIIHGCLHLIGKKDKTKNQKQKMRELEDFYINQINIK